jgi:hypothetical protein
VRLRKLNVVTQFLESSMSINLLRVVKIFVAAAMVVHTVACLFALASDISSSFGHTTWMDAEFLSESSVTRQYVEALYWVRFDC